MHEPHVSLANPHHSSKLPAVQRSRFMTIVGIAMILFIAPVLLMRQSPEVIRDAERRLTKLTRTNDRKFFLRDRPYWAPRG